VRQVGHIDSGSITLTVNGKEQQRGNISQLIWNVREIIANLSREYELFPGDLVFTGTPAGVGPVYPGDRLEGAIDGLGELRVSIGPRRSDEIEPDHPVK
jgi:fumarylpyruvate hydrolase